MRGRGVMDGLERAGYLAHAQTAGYQRRVEAARQIIAGCPGYTVAVSWGKDSVALLHLAAHVWPDVGAVNARYADQERLADTDTVRAAVLAELPGVRYREARLAGEWEMYERAGGFFMDAVTPAQRDATRWWRRQFIAGMRQTAAGLGSAGTLLGLRASESHARRLNVATHGVAYTKRDGEAIALPLARWTSQDVWAYLVSHDLPWLRMYDVSDDRERARSAFCFATGGAGAIWRHGVWTEWRRAYPEQFAVWLDRFPEMLPYV